MQFVLGALTMLCLALTIALWHVWAKFNKMNGLYGGVNTRLDNLFSLIQNLPPTHQNVIHLGLKDSKVDVGLDPAVNLPVKPEDFRIKVEKLREKLLHGFETKQHPDTETQAWCILEHAGFRAYVESNSRSEIQKGLTRLLLNGDDEATKRFLETVANSICQVPTMA
jgi:hypothetical protein